MKIVMYIAEVFFSSINDNISSIPNPWFKFIGESGLTNYSDTLFL